MKIIKIHNIGIEILEAAEKSKRLRGAIFEMNKAIKYYNYVKKQMPTDTGLHLKAKRDALALCNDVSLLSYNFSVPDCENGIKTAFKFYQLNS